MDNIKCIMVVIEVETYEDLKSHILGVKSESDQVHTKKYIFVDFYAPWCGPCKKFAPTLEELSEIYSDSIHFIKVDITKVEECQEEFDIAKLPTFIIFDRGSMETSYQPITGTNRETIENRLKQLTEEPIYDGDF